MAAPMTKLPTAILFDLDDTLLVAFGPSQSQWQRTIAAFADRLGPLEAEVLGEAIRAANSEPTRPPTAAIEVNRPIQPADRCRLRASRMR